MTDLFIGVVSHEGSRFSLSQGPAGLAAQLAARMGALGTSCLVQVNTQDSYDPSALPIDGRLVQASLAAQRRLEVEWSRFLRAGSRGSMASRVGAWCVMLARHLKQTALYVRPWHGADENATSGVRLVRRLINIELSHVNLWQAGLDSGASWILVIEDDASSPDLADCAAGLAALLTDPQCTAAYINLSMSFTPRELGIDHLISHAGITWEGSIKREILVASRPVTNTVCAIAYRADFVRSLLSEFAELPMTPVVPIDWKLNVALMRMHERADLSAGDAWLVEPGPMVQMSMRSEDAA